jgi:hypothetical protein
MEETILHKGRMVSLLFDIVPYEGMQKPMVGCPKKGECRKEVKHLLSPPLSSIYRWKRGR